MLVTYFDEVKYQEGKQPFYWLAGIVVSADEIFRMEGQLRAISKKYFGLGDVGRETEFHAADIFNRAANYKSWGDVSRRLCLLHELIAVLGSEQGIGKIHVRIEVERMVASDSATKAFMFFAEKVDDYLKGKSSPGLLIGDKENTQMSDAFVKSLSSYRAAGTDYYFGRKLQYLIDTVHFTDSHHSRMLQMADLYAWLLQLRENFSKNQLRSDLIKHVGETTNLFTPSRYKHWPTENSWIKR